MSAGEDTYAPTNDVRWSDVEADRRSRGLDGPSTVCDANWRRALGLTARLQDQVRRAWTLRWITYCCAPFSTVDRPPGAAVNRDLVLRLAELGIVDPEGFDHGPTARAPVKRKKAGVARGVAGAFKDADGRWIAPF